jgi:hypothetical protein
MTSTLVLVAGLLLALLGLVGLARGRIVRLGVRNRTGAALVAAAGMVLALAAGASPSAAPDARAAANGRQIPMSTTRSESGGEPAPAASSSTPGRTGTAGPAPGPTPPPATTATGATPAAATPTARTASAVLDALPVKGRAPRTGYDRELFGQAWADTDRNGCDTRNDVLRRDLHATVLKAGTRGCVVLSGTLDDPYTGHAIGFVRGAATSARVQIDHVVALSDAWQKGAQQWSAETRTHFANDPLNLLAVDGVTNQRKSDGDAATWLPPRTAYRCAYVARQTAVKARYRLWVTAAERDAVRRVLATCPGQRLPTAAASVPLGGRTGAATPAPTTRPTPAATTRPAPAPASHPAPALDPRFGTCGAANAGGYGPYRSGVDPEYSWYRDRDHDGVVCEG